MKTEKITGAKSETEYTDPVLRGFWQAAWGNPWTVVNDDMDAWDHYAWQKKLIEVCAADVAKRMQEKGEDVNAAFTQVTERGDFAFEKNHARYDVVTFREKKVRQIAQKLLALEKAHATVDEFATDYEDERGRVPVDAELHETLAALVIMGMHPDQSCWGHPEKAADGFTALTPNIHLTGGLPDREYTNEEVAAACEAAERNAQTLNNNLFEFYMRRSVRPEAKIVVDYLDGMPAFHLRSEIERAELAAKSPVERDRIIEAARKEWRGFWKVFGETVLKGEGVVLF